MKNNNRPIGIFDSGLGGLTVVKEIIKQLPGENIVYFGDTARVPYGTKSKETIIKYSIENTKFLLNFNIKLLVVACNTSSSYALPTLKKMLSPKIPVVGVIEPGAIAVSKKTKNYRIGVIGTSATIKSGSYTKIIIKILKNKKIKVFSTSCPLFVPLIEEGWMDKIYQEKLLLEGKKHKENIEYRIINHENILRYVATEYLLPLKKQKIDSLVLGCTHYPAIKNILQDVIGKEVILVDSAEETARYVSEILSNKKMKSTSNKNGKIMFYVSDDPEKFKLIGSLLLQKKIKNVKKVVVGK